MATEDSMTDQPMTTARILGAFRRELLAQGFGPDEATHLVYRAAERLMHGGDGNLFVVDKVPPIEATPEPAVLLDEAW